MPEADWIKMPNSLSSDWISAGQTDNASYGIVEGTKALGFHAMAAAQGFSGFVYANTGASPIAGRKGGTISACMRKQVASSGGAPCIFLVNSNDAAAGEGYLLGLSEEAPYRIVLRKGLLSGGLSTRGPGMLRMSDLALQTPEWLELELCVTRNTQGDTVIRVRRNDPPAVGPAWAAIPGMASFTDDALGRASGSAPVDGDFYAGFGHYNSGQSGRVSLFDKVAIARHTNP